MTQPLNSARGPVMVGVDGLTLTEAERQRLRHPLVGGVILFRRNFTSVAQVTALCAEIRAVRTPALLIAVDHEGGRVQRFLQGFTRLPPMQALGALWRTDPVQGMQQAENVGYVLAAELRACGIDLSFTPVLDLDWAKSAIIGDRSFGRDPVAVAALALALRQGLQRGGMACCGKHFPGHGWVAADSHLALPVDERSLADLRCEDLLPFARLSAAGMESVMPAHVVYPQVDAQPAGFSRVWLQDILRGQLGFDGVIFSDDLGMEGAAQAGGFVERGRAALAAGCDMVLLCNRPDMADQLLAELTPPANDALSRRLARMQGRGESSDWQSLIRSDAFARCRQDVSRLVPAQYAATGPAVGEAS
ncbi:MAG: beta-N-acetylhexosaminidase [Paludibacterium sp.]|uniref:beta-N-acetylhexosaminidase n=1 Tax=Paludibacterium sp. TaxID=1917523 RepID=UPI0025CC08B8|nr:beta-N-acetylhexosaminidase [Paludibacterium sp.]MBV8048270.1 beta-N-acetylhexosaminidase [Paludibacterium sp.]MBV8647194.1 beta-N-acetylhexosaminidase [Paludibacterium sp.]